MLVDIHVHLTHNRKVAAGKFAYRAAYGTAKFQVALLSQCERTGTITEHCKTKCGDYQWLMTTPQGDSPTRVYVEKGCPAHIGLLVGEEIKHFDCTVNIVYMG